MSDNKFDPSKLNIDFSNMEDEKKESILDTTSSLLPKEEDIINNVEKSKDDGNILPSQPKKEIDIELLSTILTDKDVRTEELKKRDEAKKNNLQNTSTPEKTLVFDINIKTIDDLIHSIIQEKYDFVAIEPSENYVRVIYKKDSLNKEVKYIKYPVYFALLLQLKKTCKLNTDVNNEEQKGVGEYIFQGKGIQILGKVVPGAFGETLFFKIKPSEKNPQKKVVKKSSLTIGQAFGFLGTILFIALILGGAFLTFVVFNAQTPEDVSFFTNLGINLNDVNTFLLNLTTIVFSITVLIETIILAFFIFKTFYTKKEFKKKRTVFMILSIFFLILTFATATLWITLYKIINGFDNWQELSYGPIQIFDNNLLNNPAFGKAGALIENTKSIIGPIDIKFDVKYLEQAEMRKGFKISKYIWNFGDKKEESLSSQIIHTFSEKRTYDIKLSIEGVNTKNGKNETMIKEISGTPSIGISHIVKITEEKRANGGKTVRFDATDLKALGKLEWYINEKTDGKDNVKLAYEGEVFHPSKTYFEEEMIGMKIKENGKKGLYMDRIFLISGDTSDIKGEIISQTSFDNDLEYTFGVKNIENQFGDGFIKKITWIIEGKEYEQTVEDGSKPEDSSKITHTFKNYGKQNVRVILTNSLDKSAELIKEVDVPKKIKLLNELEISTLSSDGNQEIIENVLYSAKTGEYTLDNFGIPETVVFDTKNIRSNDVNYALQEVFWSTDNSENYTEQGSKLEHEFPLEGKYTIGVKYRFVHRRNREDIVEMIQRVYLEGVKKDIELSLDIKAESEYAPTIVKFDASQSKIKDENDDITKFVYDYGDGVTEEIGAVNSGHRYLKEGNYDISLTIYTKKGKKYVINKSLILKPSPTIVNIRASLKKAPVNQEIDFISTDSIGQIVAYHWDFGDGNISTEANPSYAYQKPGKYNVVLTLDFANKNVQKSEIEIEITE